MAFHRPSPNPKSSMPAITPFSNQSNFPFQTNTPPLPPLLSLSNAFQRERERERERESILDIERVKAAKACCCWAWLPLPVAVSSKWVSWRTMTRCFSLFLLLLPLILLLFLLLSQHAMTLMPLLPNRYLRTFPL